ncbi:MAG: cupin domain-containing protein [Actinobacteria bacterium]|nr:cupin domain-containing protein [Actinomycetota bacterium]
MDNSNGYEIRRRQDTKVFIDGGEMVLRYFTTDKILFSASTLAPGQSSGWDPGHAGAHEIGYCAEGQIVLQFGEGAEREFVQLDAGDAVKIDEGVPHLVFNPGPDQARMTWSIAPSLGRPQFADVEEA